MGFSEKQLVFQVGELKRPPLLKGPLTHMCLFNITSLLFHSSPVDSAVASLALELLQAVGH